MFTKLYGGQGPVYLKVSVLVLLADVLDPLVEGLLARALDQERGVHDHAVADRLVRAERDGDAAALVDVSAT